MLKIYKEDNALVVEGLDNGQFPDNGQLSFPLNSISVVIDESEMATFRSASNNDVVFSGLIENITINGESVTKDNIIEKFDAISNAAASGGGGGGMTPEERQELKQLRSDVEDVMGEVATLEADKQNKLTAGENITIVDNVISATGGGGGDEHFVYAEDGSIPLDKTALILADKQSVETSIADIWIFNNQELVFGGCHGDVQVNDNSTQATIATNDGENLVWKGNIWSDALYDAEIKVNGEIVHQAYDSNLDMVWKPGDKITFNRGESWDSSSYNLSIWLNVTSGTAPAFLSVNAITDVNKIVNLILNGKKYNVPINIKTINGNSIVGSGNVDLPTPKTVTIGATSKPLFDLSTMSFTDTSNATQQYLYTPSTTTAALTTLPSEIKTMGNIASFYYKDATGTSKLAKMIFDIGNFNDSTYYTQFWGRTFIPNFGELFINFSANTVSSPVTTYRVYILRSTFNRLKTVNGQSLLGSGDIEISGGASLPAGNYLATFEQNGGSITFAQRGFDGKSSTEKTVDFKTINGQSIFGQGDLKIEGGGADVPTLQKQSVGTENNYIYANYPNQKYGVVAGLDWKFNSDSVQLLIKDWFNYINATNITLQAATHAVAGVMSAADKTKLDSLSNEWTGTLEEYKALGTYDDNTNYYIIEEE